MSIVVGHITPEPCAHSILRLVEAQRGAYTPCCLARLPVCRQIRLPVAQVPQPTHHLHSFINQHAWPRAASPVQVSGVSPLMAADTPTSAAAIAGLPVTSNPLVTSPEALPGEGEGPGGEGEVGGDADMDVPFDFLATLQNMASGGCDEEGW